MNRQRQLDMAKVQVIPKRDVDLAEATVELVNERISELTNHYNARIQALEKKVERLEKRLNERHR